MTKYNLGRWTWAWIVECDSCGWHILAQDKPHVENGGYMHVNAFTQGHYLVNSEARKVYA